jgi:hypothetical protein
MRKCGWETTKVHNAYYIFRIKNTYLTNIIQETYNLWFLTVPSIFIILEYRILNTLCISNHKLISQIEWIFSITIFYPMKFEDNLFQPLDINRMVILDCWDHRKYSSMISVLSYTTMTKFINNYSSQTPSKPQ